MQLKFKQQAYQSHAVEAVTDCFAGQPKHDRVTYRIDPGRGEKSGQQVLIEDEGFRNHDLLLLPSAVLENLRKIQQRQNLPLAAQLVSSKVSPLNFDVEMETGTGKTYCYIKSMFELNRLYGWSKFIVVVPSIAIREGVQKSLEITTEHFLELYGMRARHFIYDSKQLHNLESFSSNGGINVMIINVQAFNATGKDARRIYEELDDFQSRRPIDVISANRPILILDEPQKMEGKKTVESLGKFHPLMILRYSATHKTEHNKVYRLDALDAYNQKLVKKISVRGITVRGLSGTNSYLYLQSIEISTSAPTARIEFEKKQAAGIKRVIQKFGKGDIVHDVNVLNVVASESYKDFVTALQKDISESLTARPRFATEKYFTGKLLKLDTGDVAVTPRMACQIEFYLIQNGYVDFEKRIVDKYHDAKKDGSIAALPAELAPYAEQVFKLIDSVFSDADLADQFTDERKKRVNPLNANYDKKEFQELWAKINRKAVYSVHFETDELVGKCVQALDKELKISPLQYTIQRGEQTEQASFDELKSGDAFVLRDNVTEYNRKSIKSHVKYDLLGRIAETTKLTRSTVAAILQGIRFDTFGQYRVNPEDFLLKAARIINEQKATVIIEHLAYNPVDDTYSPDIFTAAKAKEDFSKAVATPNRHIYDYVFTDSSNEKNFVENLDTSREIVVYAKLPRGFSIPTPVGDYNPDWAIAFEEGKVKHIYFIAETKGSMSSMELRKIEECKIECARKFFTKITSDQVRYEVVTDYGKLMELVK